MNDSQDSVPRADISTCLMEAVDQEKEYIAQRIFPVYPSATEVGRYPKFRIQKAGILKKYGGGNSGNQLSAATLRAPDGHYVEDDRTFEWDTYQTLEYGQVERVDDKVARQMQNFFDADMVTAKFVMNSLMLDYECQAAYTAFDNNGTGGNFTTQSVVAPYTQANLLNTAATPMDVPADFNNIIEQLTLTGERPEVAVMSLHIFNLIRRSQKLQTYVYGFLNVTQGGSMITAQMIAQAFSLKEVIVAEKSIDIAMKGKAPNLQPVWGNGVIAFGKIREGDFWNGGLGRTIVWDADAPGGLFTSEEYRNEDTRSKKLRVRSERVIKTINSLCWQLLITQYS